MADFAYHHFKNYIPEEEKILTEGPIPSILQEVKSLDDYVKIPLILTHNMLTDDQIGNLSRLWKIIESVRHVSSEAVEIPINSLATLIEKVTSVHLGTGFFFRFNGEIFEIFLGLFLRFKKFLS